MYELLLIGYIIILLAIGLRTRGNEASGDFILADRSLSFHLLVASVVATFYGASAVIGGASLTYQLGLGALWFMVPFYLGTLSLVLVLRRLEGVEAYTLPDLLGKEHGRGTAAAASVLLAVLCLVPESIIAGGKLVGFLLPQLALTHAMVLVTTVIALYTLMGGMRAVVFSDLIQFVLMAVAMVLLALFAVRGTPDFTQALAPEYFDPMAYLTGQEIAVWSLLLFLFPVTSAPLFQRFFAAREDVNIRNVLVLSVTIWVAIDLCVLSSGLVAASTVEVEDPDQAIFALGQQVLPPALAAFFFVGLLAAIMSTADSFLHAGASSLGHDVLRERLSLDEAGTVKAIRVCIVLLAVVSLGLALAFQQVVPALIFLLTVWISGVAVPTGAFLLGKRLPERAAVGAIVGGAGIAVLWKLTSPAAIDPLFPGLGVSLMIALLGGTTEQKDDEDDQEPQKDGDADEKDEDDPDEE